jgi:hypothetical protein
MQPTTQPTSKPSTPTSQPSVMPSNVPSSQPSTTPTAVILTQITVPVQFQLTGRSLNSTSFYRTDLNGFIKTALTISLYLNLKSKVIDIKAEDYSIFMSSSRVSTESIIVGVTVSFKVETIIEKEVTIILIF